MEHMKKILFKLSISFVLSIVLTVGIAAVILNVYERVSCKEFFSIKKNLCVNPGLFDNCVPQGITYNYDEDCFVTSCYMSNDTESRIYKVKKGKKFCYKLRINDQPFKGHAGGIQYAGKKYYLADGDNGVYIIDASVLNDSKKKQIINLSKPVKLFCKVSYCFADSQYLYAGEFARTPFYVCKHDYSYNGINHSALVAKYRLDDLSSPVEFYSIPDNIQGFAIDPQGNIFLSSSWGLSHSKYSVYHPSSVIKTDDRYTGKPINFLDEPDRIITGPFFAEDLDFYKGYLINLTESASNKYVIGKFLFDYHIFGFDKNSLLIQ